MTPKGNELTKLVAANFMRRWTGYPNTCQRLCRDDERFYSHNGIDIRGILRAAFRGSTELRSDAGASTITQQIIKNNVSTIG